MQPLLTQVPPNRLRSIIATFIPVPASRTARDGPAWPVPITIASYLVAIGHASARVTVVYNFQGSYQAVKNYLHASIEIVDLRVRFVWINWGLAWMSSLRNPPSLGYCV